MGLSSYSPWMPFPVLSASVIRPPVTNPTPVRTKCGFIASSRSTKSTPQSYQHAVRYTGACAGTLQHGLFSNREKVTHL
jgi:hypothetical protein